MKETIGKLSIPDKIMFKQIIKETPDTIFYELHLFGQIVFSTYAKTLKECQKARDIWLKKQV